IAFVKLSVSVSMLSMLPPYFVMRSPWTAVPSVQPSTRTSCPGVQYRVVYMLVEPCAVRTVTMRTPGMTPTTRDT
ncbi:MAG: hypothetical protein WC718_19340, partial [Phycisphaerales bacterium]